MGGYTGCKRSVVVLLSLNLKFREVHARETKLNSSALKGNKLHSRLHETARI